mmetsp:Transcript_12966/g.21240  ORF Transcript_12966/g.21240 Transcript_12966/m.21240 type:complete len:90 (-) Transcript_12966:307-576(-)
MDGIGWDGMYFGLYVLYSVVIGLRKVQSMIYSFSHSRVVIQGETGQHAGVWVVEYHLPLKTPLDMKNDISLSSLWEILSHFPVKGNPCT